MLSQPIFEERLSVWVALSDLFLDTELDEADIRRIADALLGSPYDATQLERILRDEVAPAFAVNLLSVAGEWAGWSQEEVRRIMTHSLQMRQRHGWLSRIRAIFRWRMIPPDWPRVAALLEP